MLLCAVGTVMVGYAGCAPIDYSQRGRNWDKENLACSGPNQSPIDLKYDFEKLPAEKEVFFKHYENLQGGLKAAKVEWLKDKSTV